MEVVDEEELRRPRAAAAAAAATAADMAKKQGERVGFGREENRGKQR